MRLPGTRRDTLASGGWEFSHTGEIVQTSPNSLHATQEDSQRAEVRSIPRVKLESGDSFENILASDQPVILEGLDIGPCTSKWSLDYLTRQIGEERKVREASPTQRKRVSKPANHKRAQVVVHDSHSQSMDFNAKNFRYATVTFGEFAMQVNKGKRQYLRALSADAPADQPANLEQDFPLLAHDFVVPEVLRICRDNMHSSVLRISGPVHMWLHYGIVAILLGPL